MTAPRPATPTASYRLQLRGGVDLRAARRLSSYLERLGISHLYLSPLLQARSGSSHGYDVVDPTRVDPALGGEPALLQLSKALRNRGLGLVLDVVPNHMAAHPENPYFADVLARGAASPHAAWFDVDWDDAPGPPRITLPILGAPQERCLSRGELRLEGAGERACVRYFEHRLPLAPGTRPDAAEAARCDATPAGRRRLRRLLDAQSWRLVYWRRSAALLNYRRFFDVNELIALRANHPAAFEIGHARSLEWVRRGIVQGLRIDHVDGIDDPRAYLRRLRRALDRAGGPRVRPLLLVEKILGPDEELPRDWPVDGTTGYEFATAAEALFLDPAGCARIGAGWSRITGLPDAFAEIAREARRQVLRTQLAPDLRRLAHAFAQLPAARRAGLSPEELLPALVEAVAHWPVYRTYPDERGLSAGDRRRTRTALAAAARSGRAPERGLRALRGVLLPRAGRLSGEPLRLAQRFAQLAAPAAAKGVEDTALYVHTPLLSRNDVGAHPGEPLEDAVGELHAGNAARARHWPRGLLAVSTHDTKRSADVRARLDVLSEIPDVWLAALRRWRRWNAPLRRRLGGRLLDPASEIYFYQSLVGLWPLGPTAPGAVPPELPALVPRLQQHLEKAAREARRRTSWTRPNQRFEAALGAFVAEALAPVPAQRRFLEDVTQLVQQLARPGLWNAFARTLVQLGSPGLPDVYQGDEVWSFVLVDPDNRRPPDFAELRRQLARVERGFAGGGARRGRFLRALRERPETGDPKLHALRSGLHARRRTPELFLSGAYRPLTARGARAGHVFAFLRARGDRVALVAVPRLTRALTPAPEQAPVGPEVWRDTRLALPARLAGRRLSSALCGRSLRVPHGRRPELPLGELFAELPGALLLG